MRVFRVNVEAFVEVAVLADSEDEALRVATRSIDFGDLEMTEAGPADEVLGDEEEDDEYAREACITHADVVVDRSGNPISRKEAMRLIAS